MIVSNVTYEGNLRTRAEHLRSGQIILTDAPPDNQGLGSAFSPTDLCATSLASCMFTIMGIAARDRGWDLEGMSASVEKTMASDPRRIAAIRVSVTMPQGNWSDRDKAVLERAATTCPVAMSLHEDLAVKLEFHWPETAVPSAQG
jgi:putative redox protein